MRRRDAARRQPDGPRRSTDSPLPISSQNVCKPWTSTSVASALQITSMGGFTEPKTVTAMTGTSSVTSPSVAARAVRGKIAGHAQNPFARRHRPLGPILGGMLLYPLAKAKEVLRAYRDVTSAAPDELGALAALPDGTQAAGILLGFSGSIADGERLLSPLLADQVAPMPYTALQSIAENFNPPGMRNYWKSDYLAQLSDEAIDLLVEAYPSVPAPNTQSAVSKGPWLRARKPPSPRTPRQPQPSSPRKRSSTSRSTRRTHQRHPPAEHPVSRMTALAERFQCGWISMQRMSTRA